MFPKGQKQRRIRLRWSPDEGAKERVLPVGTYKVMGYRHVASADDGAEWIWSTTSPSYAEFEVKADETTHFEVRTALVVKARAFEHKGRQRVSVLFQAEKRLGNTLYREGKRIGIRWECLDDSGTVVAEGAMRYG